MQNSGNKFKRYGIGILSYSMEKASIEKEIDLFEKLYELRASLFELCNIQLVVGLIHIVDENFVSDLYDNAELHRYYEYLPLGLFLYKGETDWVAVDNSTGEAWTEGFKTKRAAVKWLLDNDNPLWIYLVFNRKRK